MGADALVEATLHRATDVIALSHRESGRLIEVSDSFCALLGYARDELIGRSSVEIGLIAAEPRDALLSTIAAADWGVQEITLNCKDGARCVVESTVQLLGGGEFMLTISRDITARRVGDMELELRAELLDLAHDAVVVREPVESRITFWNREAEAVYGYTRAEATGQITHDLLVTVFPESQEAVDEALARDGQWKGVLSHTRKDGSVIVVSSRQAVKRDRDGRQIAVIELNSDITERRRAETRVRQLLESAPDAMLSVGRDGQIVMVNSQTERLFGYRRDELIGRPVDMLVPRCFRDGHAGHRDRYFEDRSARPMGAGLALHGLRRDGSEFPAAISLSSIDTDDGPVATAAIRDDTRRELAAIVESSDDAIIGVDLRAMITSWNAGAQRLYGYSAAEVHGKSASFLAPEGHGNEISDLLARTTAEGAVRDFETVRVRKDGSLFDVSLTLSAVRDAAGRVTGASNIQRDISDRKHAETALALARADVDRLFVLSRDMMGIANRQGRFVRVNPAFEQILGFTPEEITARPFAEFIHPDDRSPAVDRTAAHPPDSELLEVENRCRCRDGSYRWLRWTRIVDQDGTVFATARDVTERRQMDAELRASRTQALEASRLKSQFVANMSHEIRTPLSGVIGMAGLLANTQLDGEQREYVDAVQASGDALMAVIEDILDFSKIEAGRLELDQQRFDVRELVEGVCTMLAAAADDKAVELMSWIDHGVWERAYGDGPRLRQVLVNLVTNAVKFTAVGEIVLRVGVYDDGERPGLCFELRDTGIGIDAAVTERIFDSFAQADSSTTRRYGGTGLGLAISKRLVELMGGQIAVKSILGEGSTFSFTVAVEPVTGDRRAVACPRIRNVRTLIVDDNQTSRAILEGQLVSWGLSCRLTSDARAALVVLRAAERSGRPYQLVVLDAGMPHTGGVELAAAIRADPSLNGAKLVMLTTSGSGRIAPAQAGINGFVTKPVHTRRLRDEITRVLDENAPSVATHGRSDGGRVDIPGLPGRPLVLVVDDVAINQQVARRLLEKRGCRVDLAADGRQALDRLAGTAYAVVFMDCQMPELDGYQATAEIRRREGTGRRTPVIAMTAHTGQRDRDRCLTAGMDDYISKPIDTTLLDDVLTRTLHAAPDPTGITDTVSAVVDSDVAGGPPVLDGARLAEICEGDDEFRAQLVAGFLDHTRETVAQLCRALQSRDLKSAQELSHKLTGSSGLLGAKRLSALTRRITDDLAAGHPIDADGDRAELEQVHALTVAALAPPVSA